MASSDEGNDNNHLSDESAQECVRMCFVFNLRWFQFLIVRELSR